MNGRKINFGAVGTHSLIKFKWLGSMARHDWFKRKKPAWKAWRTRRIRAAQAKLQLTLFP